MIEGNILNVYQSTFTIAPLIIGGLIFLMVISKVWKREKLLMLNLVVDGVCLSMFNFGFIEESAIMITATLSASVLYAIFRARSTDK